MFYKQKLSKIRVLPSYPCNHSGLLIKAHWHEPFCGWTTGTKRKLVRFCDTKLNLPLIAEIRINGNLLSESQTVVVWMNRDQRPGYPLKVECSCPGQGLVSTVEVVSCSPKRELEYLTWSEGWLSAQRNPECWHCDTKLQPLHLQNKLSPLPVTAGHWS